MNAREFYKRFSSCTKEDQIYNCNGKKRTYKEIYMFDESTYTELINKHVFKKILENIPEYICQNEYYRVDALAYSSQYKSISDEAHALDLNAYLWKPEIVFEHENNSKDWTDELVKLFYINASLRVVVGYNNCDKRENLECGKIEYASKIINKLLNGKELEGEYLIIIGNCRAKKSGIKYDSFDYRGYSFDNKIKAFKRI